MTKILYNLLSLNKIFKEENPTSVCIITSSILEKKLKWAIKEIKFSGIKIITLPDGEKAKEWNEVTKLLKKFIELGFDRNSIVIALGGGTIGDVVGFVSAIYLRGIRYIQIPTTLLAQVDSAHGGKTGINFSNYKNQIGSFNFPVAIVIDPRFLKSLSKEQVIDGLGEIIKAGLIKDTSILSLLKRETLESIVQSPNLSKIIDKSIKVKQYYVNKDPKDVNVRQFLNVGHTVGHAIELKYDISHGMAVILGMLQEFACTESLKLSDLSVRKSLINILDSLGIKTGKNFKVDWKIILHDKKILGNKMVFPVVEKEGKARLVKLDLKTFKKALK